jgi:hypothetical protein
MNDSVALSPGLLGGAASEPLDVDALAAAFQGRTAKIGVIGLGYVGLPRLRIAAERGFSALGFDIDRAKVAVLNAGGGPLWRGSARWRRGVSGGGCACRRSATCSPLRSSSPSAAMPGRSPSSAIPTRQRGARAAGVSKDAPR